MESDSCLTLGNRTVTRVLTEHSPRTREGVVAKEIAEVLDAEPFVPGDVIALACGLRSL